MRARAMKNIFLFAILLFGTVMLVECDSKNQSKDVVDTTESISTPDELNVDNVDEALDQYEATSAELIELGQKLISGDKSISSEYASLKAIYDAYKVQLSDALQTGTWTQGQSDRYTSISAETGNILAQVDASDPQ
jgi:hypothetical protein